MFPETFGPFLLGNAAVREVFMEHHADLLDAVVWQSHKERIAAGHVHDVFPYDTEKRFAICGPQAATRGRNGPDQARRAASAPVPVSD